MPKPMILIGALTIVFQISPVCTARIRKHEDTTDNSVRVKEYSSVDALRRLFVQGGFASCPLATQKGFRPLLSRDGSRYKIGEGGKNCTGSYDEVMQLCEDIAKQKIAEMDQDYERTQFKLSPWRAAGVNQKVVVYDASRNMKAHMDGIFKTDVNGLNSSTFDTVFASFAEHGCRAVVWGGEVRDAVLGILSMDTDVGWFCDQSSVVDVLKKNHWGGLFKSVEKCPEEQELNQHNLKCKKKEEFNSYVQVGFPLISDEGLEGKSAWENVLGPDMGREFTTNAMAYDPLHRVVIDTTGAGLCDTLNKRVAVAGINEEVQVVNQTEVDNFHNWQTSGFDKTLRLLKLVIPPKKYCVGRKTFALVGTEIFANIFRSQVVNHSEHSDVERAFHHIMSAYGSRSELFERYAPMLYYKFCAFANEPHPDLPVVLRDDMKANARDVCRWHHKLKLLPTSEFDLLCPAGTSPSGQ